MIYDRIRNRLLDLLRAPKHPPDPPPGTQDSVQVFRAAPNFLRYQVIVWGAGFAMGVTAELFFISSGHIAEEGWIEVAIGYPLLALTLLASLVKYFLIRLDYDMRYYLVADHSLRIREGALVIHESTFTYANVQNLRIHQGPLERLLGLSNLVVETAGGAGPAASDKQSDSPFRRGHQGVLRGVANAREVRDQILKLLKRYRDAGLGDPEDRGRAEAGPAAVRGVGGVGGLSPVALERLREIRQELRAMSRARIQHDATNPEPRTPDTLPP